MTHYEQLHALGPEELAAWLSMICECAYGGCCPAEKICKRVYAANKSGRKISCMEMILKYLESEARPRKDGTIWKSDAFPGGQR